MNPFEALLNDDVYIVDNNGDRSGPYKAALSSKGKATIFDDSLVSEEGFKLIRSLPNGREESYTIVESHYTSEFAGVSSHYDLTLRKDTSLPKGHHAPKSTVIHITNSQGIQIGDHNTQQITEGLAHLVQKIESSNAPSNEKGKAKNVLRELLTNPIVAGILGGATSGLLALLRG